MNNLSKNFCLNCGKFGHQLKICYEPIISYGIICFKFDDDLNIQNKHIENYLFNKFIDLSEYNYNNIINIKLLPHFYDKIKLLMIRRRNSLNYVEFLRGKYNINDKNHINKLFKLMSYDENLKIRSSDFSDLWNDLWKDITKNKLYHKEYINSKKKFNELKANNFYNLLEDSNLSIYQEPEWEFPKGRRNYLEKNLNCAIREFTEETNIDSNKLYILERLNCLEEEYLGTNMSTYRHVYYLASSEEENKLSINNNQIYEIGGIAWLSIHEIIEKIRPYYTKKISMVNQLYFFLINFLLEIKSNNLLYLQ